MHLNVFLVIKHEIGCIPSWEGYKTLKYEELIMSVWELIFSQLVLILIMMTPCKCIIEAVLYTMSL